MDTDTAHMYNVVTHMLIALAHMASNQQQMMSGQRPLHDRETFEGLVKTMQEKQRLIDSGYGKPI